MKPDALSTGIVVLMKSSRIPWQSGLADKKTERSEFLKNFLSGKVDGSGIPVLRESRWLNY